MWIPFTYRILPLNNPEEMEICQPFIALELENELDIHYRGRYITFGSSQLRLIDEVLHPTISKMSSVMKNI